MNYKKIGMMKFPVYNLDTIIGSGENKYKERLKSLGEDFDHTEKLLLARSAQLGNIEGQLSSVIVDYNILLGCYGALYEQCLEEDKK